MAPSSTCVLVPSMTAFWIWTMLLVPLVFSDAGMVASILLSNSMPILRRRLVASETSSTNTWHSFGSVVPRPICTMSVCTSSGGLKKPPLGPTVRIVQKSAIGFEVAPEPRLPGTPKRPLTANIVRAPPWWALIVDAVAAPPPPTTRTSVS